MTLIGIAAAAVALYGAWLISTGLYWSGVDKEGPSREIDVLVGLVLMLVGSFTAGVIVRLG